MRIKLCSKLKVIKSMNDPAPGPVTRTRPLKLELRCLFTKPCTILPLFFLVNIKLLSCADVVLVRGADFYHTGLFRFGDVSNELSMKASEN